MSHGFGIRSKGDPYFALVQQASMGDASAPYEDPPFFQMEIQFRLDRLPVMKATEDEYHVLMSLVDLTDMLDLAWIGITPSGRLAVGVKGGPVVQTSQGFVNKSNRWHEVQMWADHSSSDLLQLRYNLLSTHPDDVIDIPAAPAIVSSNAARSPIRVPSGNKACFMLLNGASGLNRTELTLWYASVIAGNDLLEQFGPDWHVDEGDGRTVRADYNYVEPAAGFPDLTLTAQWFTAVASPPWPFEDTGDDPAQGFRWERIQSWRRRELPDMDWRRVA